MRILRKRTFAIFGLISLFMVVFPFSKSANAYRSNCGSVNKSYPFGVALNRQNVGSSRAEVNRSKYIQLKYLDKDLDGIVCEIERLQTSTTTYSSSTSTTISSVSGFSGDLNWSSFETQGGVPLQSESIYRKCANGTAKGVLFPYSGCTFSNVMIRMYGSFKIDYGNPGSEHYVWFYSHSKDGFAISVNGQTVINQWNISSTSSVKVLGGYFRSGEKYPIDVWLFNNDGSPTSKLWFGVDGMDWALFNQNSDCSFGCRLILEQSVAPVSNYWRSSTAQTVAPPLTTIARVPLTSPNTIPINWDKVCTLYPK